MFLRLECRVLVANAQRPVLSIKSTSSFNRTSCEPQRQRQLNANNQLSQAQRQVIRYIGSPTSTTVATHANTICTSTQNEPASHDDTIRVILELLRRDPHLRERLRALLRQLLLRGRRGLLQRLLRRSRLWLQRLLPSPTSPRSSQRRRTRGPRGGRGARTRTQTS